MVVNKTDEWVNYHLAWQQGREIKYNTLTPNFSSHNIDIGQTVTTVSTNSGFTYNKFPSITLANGNNLVFSWVGINSAAQEKMLAKGQVGISPLEEEKVVVKSGLNGNYFNGGDNVKYVNI